MTRNNMHLFTDIKNKRRSIVTAVFLITVFIASVPLISRYCISGHDLEYHLLRIESLKEGILAGKPFLKVNVLYFGGAGYASSMFYPDFMLYIPALLRVLGVSINSSYHIFVAICIILCYLTTYKCTRAMTGSTYGAMVAAVMLTLCPYHLDDIYVRSAVGEYTAFIFVPVIIYALYNILYEEMDKPQLFVLGYMCVLLCHTSTFIMCTVFGAAVLLLHSRRLFGKGKLFAKLLASVAVTLLLTAFYWLPMLEQFADAKFYVSTPWMDPKDAAVGFANIFGPSFPALGSICVLALIPRIFMKRTRTFISEIDTDTAFKPREMAKESRSGRQGRGRTEEESVDRCTVYADILIAAGAVFTFCACDILPWGRIGRYFSFIQFPWRFFIMGSCLFAVAAGLIYGRIAGRDEDVTEIWVFDKAVDSTVINTGAVIITALLILCGYNAFAGYGEELQGYYDYSDDYYSYKPYTANVIAGEWLPQTVTDRDSLLSDSEEMTASDGTRINFRREGNAVLADIDEGFEYIDVPLIYYKGYAAKLTDGNGGKERLKVSGEGRNGLCRVYMNGHDRGTLTVLYEGTRINRISVLISMLALAVTARFYFIRLRKRGDAASGKEGHE
jgi:predicted small integral membrane protein